MRLHARQIRRPSEFAVWWDDVPMRRRWWWRQVLFEPGAGWLTWKSDWRSHITYDPPDMEEWVVFPPLHRAWFTLRSCWGLPWMAARGLIRWREAWPSLADTRDLIDDDRKRLYR